MPRIRAVEFIRPMRGASQPHLVRCDDGCFYVVKFQRNPQHIRVLANEMLAGRLALLVGLPAPPPAIVEVLPELVASHPLCEAKDASRRPPLGSGLQFGSRFPGVPSQVLVVDFLPDRLLRKVKNLSVAFLGAYLLDKWTCNCDGRQMIFYRPTDAESSAYSALLIDQGFCFNDGEWNFPDNTLRSVYPRRLVYENVRGLGTFEPFLSRVENVDPEGLEACVRDIPEEWCGGPREEICRLVERLYERRRWLRQAIIDAKNSSLRPFPNWR